MVVNAVGEPDALQINLQGVEVLRMMVNGQVCIDDFQHFTDTKIVSSILVEGDVTPIERGFRKIINQLLLL